MKKIKLFLYTTALLLSSLNLFSQCETGSQNFTTVGATTWTVPGNVAASQQITFEVTLKGGDGGSSFRKTGGEGATQTVSITATAGEQFTIFVGGKGGDASGNGGAGGGGASAINKGSTIYAIAGGGGGAGYYQGLGGLATATGSAHSGNAVDSPGLCNGYGGGGGSSTSNGTDGQSTSPNHTPLNNGGAAIASGIVQAGGSGSSDNSGCAGAHTGAVGAGGIGGGGGGGQGKGQTISNMGNGGGGGGYNGGDSPTTNISPSGGTSYFSSTVTDLGATAGVNGDDRSGAAANDGSVDICLKTVPQTGCNAGPNAPSTEATIYIPCGQTTIDLSNIVSDRKPAGTSVSFHSGTPATISNEVSNANALSLGTYYIAHKATDAATNTTCFSPTLQIKVEASVNCSVKEAGCNETIANGVHAGGATGTITSTAGNATYAITKVSSNGYTATEGYSIDSENGVRVQNNFDTGVNNDAFTYTYKVTPESGVTPQIRFYQTRGVNSGNNEASRYTISWVGGTGNAIYYDNRAPDCNTVYEAAYGSGCPTGFNNLNREIVGLATTGEVNNGGFIDVYMVKNNGTAWYVEFPKGATSVTVTKVVNTGGVTDASNSCGTQPNSTAVCGIDSQFPFYGSNQSAPNVNGESFNEWISFNTKLISSGCATITGTAFNDGNQLSDNTVNGTKIGSAGSTPLYANLLDASGKVVASVPLNADGGYTFTNVIPGSGYTVQISTTSEAVNTTNPTPTLPSGWNHTGENIGSGAGSDGTVDGKSAPINAVANQTVSDVNFGLTNSGSISGTVTEDENGDGNGTTGIAGVTMTLKNADGTTATDINGNPLVVVTSDGTTDANGDGVIDANDVGFYQFTNVPPGDYKIVAGDKTGYQSVKDGDTTNPTDDAVNANTNDQEIPVTVAVGESDTGNDFVYAKSYSVTGTVFNDTNGDNTVNGTGLGNPDGTQLYVNIIDANGNVVATAPVNADGTYQVDGVPIGTHTVQITTNPGTKGEAKPATELPASWSNTGDNTGTAAGNDGNANGEQTITVTNANVTDVNYGIQKTGTISGTVKEDTTGDGTGDTNLGGVTLNLLDSSGNPVKDANGNNITTTTNPDGTYKFENVPPGTGYQVQEVDPTGKVSSSDTEGANDNKVTGITVTAGQDSPNNNFVDVAPVTISGTVLADENGDGTIDTPKQGVVIQLLDSNGVPVTDASGQPITATTDANGAYSFTNIPPGNYQLKEVKPADYTAIGDADGNTNSTDFETIKVAATTPGSTTTGQNFSLQLTSTLPVILSEFTVAARGADAVLSWTTASEVNNERFDIERSYDGQSFEIVGSVAGNGTTKIFQTYTFRDIEALNADFVYYRLKQVDYDGLFDISAIKMVRGMKKSIQIYPNPIATNNMQISRYKEGDTYAIYDLHGRILLSGLVTSIIDVSEISKGSYIVKIIDATGAIKHIEHMIKTD